MIHKLTANWGLKLIAFAFAAMLWFLVTNISNPTSSRTFNNIPVTLKNTEVITASGQVYEVLDDTDTISRVSIQAPRSVCDALTRDDITAVADFADLTSRNTVSIQVSVNSRYSNEILSLASSSDTMKLSVEKKVTRTLPLEATTSGVLSDGYIIGTVSTAQNMIRITGPESAVNAIAKASVDVDVTGFTSAIGTNGDIRLYDAEAHEIRDASIKKNIDTVGINVAILKSKYVGVTYIVAGKPADGYMLTGQIDGTPDSILIAGRSDQLDEVDTIRVEDEDLDVTGLTGNLQTAINLTPYLPNGMIFGDPDFNGIVSVDVHVERIAEKTIRLSEDHITITGIPEDQEAEVELADSNTTVPVVIRGLRKTLDGINAADLNATADFSDQLDEDGRLKSGSYEEIITLQLPKTVSAESEIDATFVVTVEESAQTESSSEAAQAEENAGDTSAEGSSSGT